MDTERAPILETLDKQSNWDDFVVLVLRGDAGPCFLPKLATADLRRCTRQVYYDGSFASLAFGFGLTCNGRPSRIFSEIQQHFRRKDPSVPAELLPKNANLMLAIMEDILELPDVGDVRTRLIQQATDAGQWVVVAHDATIKIMASVIGAAEIGFHAKHGSKAPQCVHTVRGMTGAVAKCVAAPTEAREHCASAIKDALPLNARKQTKLLFTDNPKTFAGSEAAVVKTKRVFPNISCVAEDPMHLAFRTEDHFGQRRGSNIGKYIRRAQIKFANKVGAPVADGYFWGGTAGPEFSPLRTDSMTAEEAAEIVGRLNEDSYLSRPYSSHAEYRSMLEAICNHWKTEMGRKNSKGDALHLVLSRAARPSHYRFLSNGSKFMAGLATDVRAAVATGTTGCESTHSELNTWDATVTWQHLERARQSLAFFTFAKPITRNSAAYSPTLCQMKQCDLLRRAAGAYQRGFARIPKLRPSNDEGPSSLKTPALPWSMERKQKMDAVRRRKARRTAADRKKRSMREGVKIPTSKRTVFTASRRKTRPGS